MCGSLTTCGPGRGLGARRADPSSLSRAVILASAVTSFVFNSTRAMVWLETVRMSAVIDSLSAKVALARLSMAVTFWRMVFALFDWNPANRAVYVDSTSSSCALAK